MADKNKSDNSTGDEDIDAPEASAKDESSADGVDVEEVDVEIVTGKKPASDPINEDTDGVIIETELSDPDVSEIGASPSTPDEKVGMGGISPGIVFLSVLAIIGAIAAGLWAMRSGPDAPTIVIADTEQDTISEITPTDTPTEDATKVTSKSTLSTKEEVKPAKIANNVDNAVKTAAMKIDPATVSAKERGSLPAAPLAAGANSSIQKAAKEAAKKLAPKAQVPVVEPPVVQAPSNKAPISKVAEAQDGVDALEVAGDTAETVGDIADNNGQQIKEISTENLEARKVPDQVAQAAEKVTISNADLGVGPSEDIATAIDSVGAQVTETVVDKAADTIAEEVDPVADAAELFASNPNTQETPADQLGADPIAAIESLQAQAAAQVDVPAGGATKSVEGAVVVKGETDSTIVETNKAISPETVSNKIDDVKTTVAGDQDREQISPEVDDVEQNSIADFDRVGGEDVSDTAIETAVVTAPVKPAPPSFESSNEAVAEKFAGEIAALEESFEERTSRISDALNEERERATEQAEEIERLKSNLDEALKANEQRNSEEISRLRQRIDQLQSAEEKKANTTERQTAGLLALISLQRAFDQGTPYRRELDVLQGALPNAVNYNGLSNAADAGAPTIAALKERFPEAIRSTMAGAQKSAKGPIGHIMRNLQALVSVRPATPQEGESVTAIISRAEGKLERDDLGGAISELEALGGASSDEMSAWIEDASKRHQASTLLADINDGLLAGVGK